MSAATNSDARVNRMLKLDEFKELREVATECKTIQNEIDKQTKLINRFYDKIDKLKEEINEQTKIINSFYGKRDKLNEDINEQTKIIDSLYDKRDKLIEDRVCSIEEYKKIRAKHQWERPARRRTIEIFDSDSSGGKKIKKEKKSVKTPKKKPTKYLR